MSRNRLFWAAILIIAGVLFLLNNLGILTVNIWGIIWPLALILIGGEMLWSFCLRRKVSPTQQLSIPLENASGGTVDIHHGAGRLTLGATSLSGDILSGRFLGGVLQDVRRTGPDVRIKLEPPSEVFWGFPFSTGPSTGFQWNVDLTDQIPLALELHTGAGESDVDLTNLKITDLLLETGASSTRITLPANAGFTRVHLESGAASISVRVPDQVAARIRTQSGLSSIHIDTARFPRMGDAYESPDFSTALNRVEIQVETGVGSVSIR